MIKAIIFDLNGVFIQSELFSERIEKRFGISADTFFEKMKGIMEVARKPGLSDSFVLWKPVLKDLGIRLNREEFFEFWFSGEHLIREFIDYTIGLREKGIKVFVLSNNFKERTEYYRKKFPELFKSVDKIYFSWETGNVKPDFRAFVQPVEENGLVPGDCLYFDDSEKNLEAARSLGITAEKFEGFDKTKRTIQEAMGERII